MKHRFKLSATIFLIAFTVLSSYGAIKGVPLLTTFLLSFLFVVPVFTCFISRKINHKYSYDIFEPGSILAILTYFYVVLPAVNNLYFDGNQALLFQASSFENNNYLLSLIIIGLISYYIGYKVNIKKTRIKKIKVININHFSLFLFIVIGVLVKAIYLNKIGVGLNDLFDQLSPSVRRSYAENNNIHISGYYIILNYMLLWAVLVFVFRYVSNSSMYNWKKTIFYFILLIVIIIEEYILSGKRSSVMFIVLYVVVWVHYFHIRISIFKAARYLVISFAIVSSLLMARVLIPLYMQDNITIANEIEDNAVSQYLNSGEFATYDMMIYTIENKDNLLEDLDGSLLATLNYNLLPIALTLIPRAIWTDKPAYRDISHQYGKRLLNNPEIGIAVTIFGVMYLLYGIFGVFIGMFVVGVFCKFIYMYFNPLTKDPSSIFYYAILLWILFQYFRFGTLGFTWLVFVHSQLIGIVILYLSQIKLRA